MRHGVRAVLVIGLASPVYAQEPKDCDALVETARAHHEAERYADALAAAREAHACSADPALLYTMGQLAFNLEDYEAAEGFYTQFLATNPAAEDAALTLQALAVTRERIAAKRQPRPEKIVLVPSPPKRADKLAWGFAIAGGLSAVTGGILYFTARQRAVDTSGRYVDYDDRVASSRTLRTTAIVFGGASVAFGVVAAVRWLAQPDREAPAKRATTAIVPIGGGDAIGIGVAGEL